MDYQTQRAREEETLTREFVRSSCARIMDLARESVRKELERTLRAQLEAIHARSFRRHRLRFLDAMGIVSVVLECPYRREDFYVEAPNPFGHGRCVGIRDLETVKGWYLTVREDADVQADDITIEPLN